MEPFLICPLAVSIISSSILEIAKLKAPEAVDLELMLSMVIVNDRKSSIQIMSIFSVSKSEM